MSRSLASDGRARASLRGLRALIALALLTALAVPAGSVPRTASAAETPALVAILSAGETGGTVWRPSDVAVATDGTVYALDTGDGLVRVVAPDGRLLATIGDRASGGASLDAPRALALAPDGSVVIVDTGASRVVVLGADGALHATFGGQGSGPGQLDHPEGVAVGADGAIWVSDTGNHRIVRFSATGTPELTFGSAGAETGQLDGARGIALSPDGTALFVADANNRRIQRFDAATGAFVAQWGWTWVNQIGSSRFSSPSGVEVDAAGALYVTDTGNCRVEISDGWGNVTGGFGAAPGGSAVGQLSVPRAVALAADGTLYVADTGNERIQRRNASGTWLSPWQPGGSAPGLLSAPRGVAWSGTAAYVADTGNSRVEVLDAAGVRTGGFGTPGAGAGQLSAPAAIAYDAAAGRVLVADTGNSRVAVFSAGGAWLGSFGTGQLLSPKGIVVDPAGVTYVADTGHGRIAVFDAAGAYQRAVGTSGTAPGQLSAPEGVALDSRNKLFVADTGNHRVEKFDAATGAFATWWGGLGTTEGQFTSPRGVAVDAGDAILVADTGNDRVQVFAPTLTLSEVVGAPGSTRLSAPSGVAIAGDRVLVTEAGTSRLRFLARDGVAPTVSADGIPATPTRANVGVTLAGSDGGSGVSAILYRIGGGLPQRYTTPLSFTAEGPFTVTAWAVDRAGNAGAPVAFTGEIDRTAPAGDMLVAAGTPWVATSTLDVASSVSGAAEMRFGYDAVRGPWVPYADAATVTIPGADGIYTVYGEYRDAAGNVLSRNQVVALDTTGPGVSGLGSTSHVPGVPDRATTASFVWDPSSDDRGIGGYSYVLDRDPAGVPDRDIDTADTAATIADIGHGTWYFHVRACDSLGNWGLPATVRIDVDRPSTLTTPLATRIPFRVRSVFVRGTVSPAQSGTVRVIGYHAEAGRWVARATFLVPLRVGYDGVARYTLTTPALAAGTWRFVAVCPQTALTGVGKSPASVAVLVR